MTANWVQALTIALFLTACGYAGWCETRRRDRRKTTGLQRMAAQLIADVEAYLVRHDEFRAWERDRQEDQ